MIQNPVSLAKATHTNIKVEESSSPRFTINKVLDNSNNQWRKQENYNINASQQENKNNVLKTQRDTLYGIRHFKDQNPSKEIGNNNPNLTNGISNTDKQLKNHGNPFTYISDLESNNQDSISTVKNIGSSKNVPILNNSVSKPNYKNNLARSKVTQNVLLENTFGKVDNKSFRQKRKGPNFSLDEESNSVGYTKFTMDGVDILYSFPKETPTKASKRQKKQVTTMFQRKKKEVTNAPYSDYDINKKYIGSISVKSIISMMFFYLP